MPKIPGPAIDAMGNQAIDPTANVIALNKAAVSRLNDVVDLNMLSVKDALALHVHYQDQLREDSERHIKELMALRALHSQEMQEREASRLNFIRSVDVAAVAEAAKVTAAQTLAIANTLQVTADAMRTQTQAVAVTVATAQANALEPIIRDISESRRIQYEQAGAKTQKVEGKGTSQWLITTIVAVLGLMMTLTVSVAVGLLVHYAK